MGGLLQLTLCELCETLASKRASPVELMREVFAAVDAHNPKLNAIVAERDRDVLLREAREAEHHIASGAGRALEGVPFGVKDMEDIAGLPTTFGSKLFAEHVATRDSSQVARLRSAGAIAFGKTNMPEFGATAITRNLIYGTTRSPWDLEATPGGSSGGSAAALAAEILPLVTASDGGGSIRIPASFVGAFGLKPNYGRVSRGPVESFWLSSTLCYGPLTKTVADAALVLDCTAGYDPLDPMSLPSSDVSYRRLPKELSERKWRIGYSPDFGYAVVQSDVAAAVEDGVRQLERMGHRISLLRDGPPQMTEEWGQLFAFEQGADILHLRSGRDSEISRGFLQQMKAVEAMPQATWASMMQKRARIAAYFAQAFEQLDFLVTPTTPYDAPPARGPFPAETEGRVQIAAGVGAFTIPTNLSLHPAASLRVGLSKRGLPVGLQLIAPHYREDQLLALCSAFEAERPAHPMWPLRQR